MSKGEHRRHRDRSHLGRGHRYHDRRGCQECHKKRCESNKQIREDPCENSRENRSRTRCAPKLSRKGPQTLGAKAVAFLLEHLWILAIAIAYALYERRRR